MCLFSSESRALSPRSPLALSFWPPPAAAPLTLVGVGSAVAAAAAAVAAAAADSVAQRAAAQRRFAVAALAAAEEAAAAAAVTRILFSCGCGGASVRPSVGESARCATGRTVCVRLRDCLVQRALRAPTGAAACRPKVDAAPAQRTLPVCALGQAGPLCASVCAPVCGQRRSANLARAPLRCRRARATAAPRELERERERERRAHCLKATQAKHIAQSLRAGRRRSH